SLQVLREAGLTDEQIGQLVAQGVVQGVVQASAAGN
ncbi:MAG: hypothetical protein RJA10_2771, partial [Pseudomonadota bacterium]